MRVTIYLAAVEQGVTEIREIRAQRTHALLATCDTSGIWLFDRKSREHHRLSWEELAELQRQIAASAGAQQVGQKSVTTLAIVRPL